MVYITTMYRFGSTERHSYIVGAYSSKEQAQFAGECEKSWRGGKYDYLIKETELNSPVPEEIWKYHMECV